MGRPKAHPNLPEYMVKVGAAYKVKRPIPEHAWAEFPELKGKARIKVVSLGTDEKSAKRRFLSEIEAIETRIERASLKGPNTAKPIQPSEPRLYEPKEIIDAIDRWKSKRIEANQKFGQERELKELHGVQAPLEEFSGRDLLSHRLDAISDMSRRVMKEEGGRAKSRYFVVFDPACFSAHDEFDAYNAIPDFHEKLALALNDEGIKLRSDAPILGRAFAVEAFAGAWSRVLKSELHWLCGSELHSEGEWEGLDLSPTQEGDGRSSPVKIDGVDAEAAKQIDTLSKLFAYYENTEVDLKNMNKKRQWWRLLVRNFGDVAPSDITAFKNEGVSNIYSQGS